MGLLSKSKISKVKSVHLSHHITSHELLAKALNPSEPPITPVIAAGVMVTIWEHYSCQWGNTMVDMRETCLYSLPVTTRTEPADLARRGSPSALVVACVYPEAMASKKTAFLTRTGRLFT